MSESSNQRRRASAILRPTGVAVPGFAKKLGQQKQSANEAIYLLQPKLCQICSSTVAYKNRHRKTCSDPCKRIMIGNTSSMNENCGGRRHSKRTPYKNLAGECFILESSYEVLLAQILNALSIQWVRPSFLRYLDSTGKNRRYHPDFYLLDYDLYIDPKNDYLAVVDQPKIKAVSEQTNKRIIILRIAEINKENINSLILAHAP